MARKIPGRPAPEPVYAPASEVTKALADEVVEYQENGGWLTHRYLRSLESRPEVSLACPESIFMTNGDVIRLSDVLDKSTMAIIGYTSTTRGPRIS